MSLSDVHVLGPRYFTPKCLASTATRQKLCRQDANITPRLAGLQPSPHTHMFHTHAHVKTGMYRHFEILLSPVHARVAYQDSCLLFLCALQAGNQPKVAVECAALLLPVWEARIQLSTPGQPPKEAKPFMGFLSSEALSPTQPRPLASTASSVLLSLTIIPFRGIQSGLLNAPLTGPQTHTYVTLKPVGFIYGGCLVVRILGYISRGPGFHSHHYQTF
jgi:hypothetical protein